jgi:hypothetical protein
MKTSTLTTLASLALLSTFAVGCAYRSPEMWRDDTNKVLEAKNNDIRACYDGYLKGAPGAGGKVTVKFEVETEGGKIQNVQVDTAGTTAPPEVGECVKKNIEGLVISPPDRRVGQATYVYDFSQPKS